MLTSQTFQQYVRVFFYSLFSALASYGITVPDNTKTIVFSMVGLLANLAWTIYGTRLNALLEQVKEKTGVTEIKVVVDPDLLPPDKINTGTTSGITATPKGQ